MKRNDIVKCKDKIYRILSVEDNQALIIDCLKATMPLWVPLSELTDNITISEEELFGALHTTLLSYEDLTKSQRKTVQEKYNIIAPIINCVDIPSDRNELIKRVSERKSLSKQTIRKYLCHYLIYQDICCFLKPQKEMVLSQDERNFRHCLNKYYYNSSRRSLHTCYLYLLREHYSDSNGNLNELYPPFHRFKYFFYKTRKNDNYYISRYGKAQYERDYKPLLGDTQSFFNSVGVGMADSTIADIWLVDNQNNLIGRSVITALICPYSELCLGYSIGLEGGNTSLRELIINANSKYGIPTQIYTDRGKEYLSDNFGQLTDLGVEIINLKAFAPNLKGMVEKFLDVVQSFYKQYLQNKGVINKDFAIRGAPNYQRQATLTIEEFQHIMEISIEYYNTQRLIKNIPYDCVINEVKPFSIDIFNCSLSRNPNSFIHISNQELEKVLLPRTNAKFTRKGLIVNGLRYRALGYVDRFLQGGKAIVAYNPFNVSFVFLVENGEYVKFELIEQFFKDKSLEESKEIQRKKRNIIKKYSNESLQSEMHLGADIDTFIKGKNPIQVNTKNVRENRANEIKKEHIKKGLQK